MPVLLPYWASNFLKIKFWKLFLIFFDKMVSILIIQHEQYFFLWAIFHAKLCSSLMSHHQVNNKCSRVKGQHSRWLIYALHNFILCNMLHVFRSNHHCSWKFPKFHRKTPMLGSLFFLSIMKLHKGIFSAWISHTSAELFFS